MPTTSEAVAIEFPRKSNHSNFTSLSKLSISNKNSNLLGSLVMQMELILEELSGRPEEWPRLTYFSYFIIR